MQTRRLTITVAVAAMSLSAPAMSAIDVKRFEDVLSAQVAVQAERFKLSNGLTVVVHKDQSAPLVHVNLTYHVGSKNEPSRKSELAHH